MERSTPPADARRSSPGVGRTASGQPPSETTELPELSPGVQLFETDVRGALPALVVDHVLGGSERTSSSGSRAPSGGRALWADANGHARTRAIADVAPNRRVLRRVDVARGFTAFQHYAIVDALAERALAAGAAADSGDDADGERGGSADGKRDDDSADGECGGANDGHDDAVPGATPRDPSDVALLVAPAIDAPYRDDGLRGDEGREMLVRALARLAGVARRLDVPVLVTRTRDDELAAPVANAASETIHCERTPMGPRFAGDEFETLVYPAGDGLVQTTLAFWQRVLERRSPDWIDEPGAAAAEDAPASDGAVGDGAAVGSDAGVATGPATGDQLATPASRSAALETEPATTGQPALVRGEPVATPTATDRVRTEVLARGAD